MGDSESRAFNSTSSTSSRIAGLGTRGSSSILNGRKRKHILDRDYGEHSEMFELSKTGKKKHIFRQSVANQKANDNILKSINNFERHRNLPLDSGQVSHRPSSNELAALRRMR